MIRKIVGLHYSPLGGTAEMTKRLVGDIATRIEDCSAQDVSVACCDMRETDSVGEFDEETVAILSVPSHVGKVPLKALKAMRKIEGKNTLALVIVSYGGRSYGNSLYELKHYADELGFKVIGAGAFAISYMAPRGSSRSSALLMDVTAMSEFGKAASDKIRRLGGCEIDGLKIKPAPLDVSGKLPVHKVSRISPGAAAIAQSVLEKVTFRRRESEWFL